MNHKLLLLTLGCIIFLASDSVSAFQTTAYKSPRVGQTGLKTQDRSQEQIRRNAPSGLNFRRPQSNTSAIGVGGFNGQQNGVAMQSVIINGQVVLLPAISHAAQTQLTQLQQLQQQRRQQQLQTHDKTPEPKSQTTVFNEAALASPTAEVQPLRVKSKYFDAETDSE